MVLQDRQPLKERFHCINILFNLECSGYIYLQVYVTLDVVTCAGVVEQVQDCSQEGFVDTWKLVTL